MFSYKMKLWKPIYTAYSQRRTCRPPPPPQKWPHQKVIVNGAQCSESNGNDNKKIPIFIFRVIIENWGDFSEI